MSLSVAVAAQVRVSLLVNPVLGVRITLTFAGILLEMVIELEVKEEPSSYPSFGVAMT